MIVAGFEWDGGNREKCQKHGLAPAEIEAVFSGPVTILPDEAHSWAEERKKAIGRAGGRHVFVVFTLREKDGLLYIRPISARYMHKREIESYEEGDPDL